CLVRWLGWGFYSRHPGEVPSLIHRSDSDCRAQSLTKRNGALVDQRKIAIIGLGYVGLPVAVAFARSGAAVVGFDIDRERIEELCTGYDRTREVEKSQLAQPTLVYTDEAEALADANFYIVTVPTPINALRRPDLSALFRASDTVGRSLKRGDIVVFES